MFFKTVTIAAAVLGCAVSAAQAAEKSDEFSAMFARVTEWAIDYSAENGLPSPDVWRITVPPERLSIVERDGGKALCADSRDLHTALFRFKDAGVLDRFFGTVLVEMELAIPEPPPAGIRDQFFFALSCAGSRRCQTVLGLSGKSCDGTFSSIGLPEIPYGKFFTVRIALDVDGNTGELRIDGKRFVCDDLPRMIPYKNYLVFGDGGKSTGGRFELRRLRVTATEMKTDKEERRKDRR